MADPISLQQVLISAPVDEAVGTGDFVLAIGGGSIKLVPMDVIKPVSVPIQDFLTGLPRDAEPAGDVVTVVSGALRRGPVSGLGGGGIASPDAVALALYSLGMMTVVVGPAVAGTDPPQMATSTAARVAHLESLGIPPEYIGWSVSGEEVVAGVLVVASASITPQVSSAALVGVLPAADITVTPSAVAVGLVGVLAVDGVSVTPFVDSIALTGTLTADSVNVTPSVGAAELVPEGVLAADSVSVTPAIDVSELVGVLAADSVTVAPTVDVAPLVGVVAADSVSVTPAIGAADLVSASTPLPADNVSVTPVADTVALVGVLPAANVSVTPSVGAADLTAAIPSAPTQSALTVGDGQLTANWTDVSGETSYTVYYSTSSALDGTTSDGATAYPGTPNATAGKISGIAANSVSQAITGITNGATYYVRVSASNASGTSALSSVQSAAPRLPLTVTDNFDRADASTLGTNYVKPSWALSNVKIVSNQAAGSTSGSYSTVTRDTAIWNPSVNTFAADQYAECTFADAVNGGARLLVRVDSSTETYYGMRCDGLIYKVVGGANRGNPLSDQRTALGTVAATDVIRLSVQGNAPAVLRIYKNGVLKATVNDSTSPITSGQPGIMSDSGGYSQVDNFVAGEL